MFYLAKTNGLLTCLITACIVLVLPAAGLGDDDVVAYQVKVVLKHGAEFAGVVQDRPTVTFFEKNTSMDLNRVDKRARINLYYVGGMNGMMGVYLNQARSVDRLDSLTSEQLTSMRSGIDRRLEVVRQQDQERIERQRKYRDEMRKKKEAEARERKKQEEAQASTKSAEGQLKWILKFPPDKGWGPKKKAELYQRGVTIGIFPNAEEQEFLDHFDEWMKQYEIWKVIDDAKEALVKEAEKVEKEISDLVGSKVY